MGEKVGEVVVEVVSSRTSSSSSRTSSSIVVVVVVVRTVNFISRRSHTAQEPSSHPAWTNRPSGLNPDWQLKSLQRTRQRSMAEQREKQEGGMWKIVS